MDAQCALRSLGLTPLLELFSNSNRVRGFIVYSRIDNFQGRVLGQTEQSIQKMMICTAGQQPSPHHHHGKHLLVQNPMAGGHTLQK